MIKAIALVVDEHKILRPLEQIIGLHIEYVVIDEGFKFTEPYPDIVLTISDWRAEIARILLEAKVLNIPTLMFQDGTLDWIIQYEGDKYGGNGGPTHFHPILTDKIAVMGHQSARVLSAWNDPSKVEVVGFPILHQQIQDAVKYRESVVIDKEKKCCNVLVTSTRQGWFCERQKTAFIQALLDLKSYFETDRNFHVNWRLSRDLAKIIGVQNDMKLKESIELVPLLKNADIVISAQSTVVVEAMLFGKPVAIIDYLNVPQFYGTAWIINSKSQIASTIECMKKADLYRLLFQEYQLVDILNPSIDSILRSKLLIERMVEFKSSTNSTDFPENLLGFNSPFQTFNPTYPENHVFPKVNDDYKIHHDDFARLITRYRHENKLLKDELKKKSFLYYFLQFKNRLLNGKF